MNLEQIYQICTIIIGFGGLIVAYMSLMRSIKKDKHMRTCKHKKKY